MPNTYNSLGKAKREPFYFLRGEAGGKDFAASLTNDNIRMKDLNTTPDIADEHSTNNDEVRQLLIRRGIVPEGLPVAEDTKKVQRGLNSEDKKLQEV